MWSLFLYIAIFILTALFIRVASSYYAKYKGVAPGEECFEHAECPRSDVNLYALPALAKKERKVIFAKYILFFVLAFLPLFFLSAVRYGIGTDYFYTYVPNFYRILYGERAYSEYGFYLFNKLIQLFTNDPQWLFVITSFIFVFFFVRTVIHCSVSAEFSVIVLFCTMIYFWSLNNVRQAVAVVFVFAAFPHLLKRHTVRYLIYTAVAFVFHITAIGMIIPYIIIHVKYIRRYFIYVAVLITVLLPVMSDIAVHLMSFTKYSYYFNGIFNTGGIEFIRIGLNLGVFVVSYMILHNTVQKSMYAYALEVMQFFAFWVIAISYFIGIPEMLVRIMNYFQIYQVLLIPYCAKMTNGIERRVVVQVTYIIFFGAYNTGLLLKGDHEVIPYKWIFGVN